MSTKSVRSICFEAGCHCRCGVLLEVQDDRIVGIKGDKDHPFSQGFTCPKGRAVKEVVYHPDRITRPLVRVGAKGSGRFEPVTWDQALETIAEKLLKTREQWGAEALVSARGRPAGCTHISTASWPSTARRISCHPST